MASNQSNVEYLKPFANEDLHFSIISKQNQIEKWFRNQWAKYPPPFYSSIDIRNAGFKIAPVDTNLFPAGFNNLDKELEFLYISAIQHFMERISPEISKILLITEDHTRNKFYESSIESLTSFIRKSGFDIKITKLIDLSSNLKDLSKTNGFLSVDGFIPDIIVLNNDLSGGMPEYLNNIKQQIIPNKNIGWNNRSKTDHCEYYSNVADNFSRLIEIDSWLIEPYFRNCGEIDFQTKQGEDCLIYNAEKLFHIIQKKYDEYEIKEKPYIMIKADSGTYGMGIILINDIDSIKNLNRKQRTKMSKIKGGNKLNKVILQEGIYSYEKFKPTNHVAEPVIYSFGHNLVGGFYRMHDLKNNSENLNSPGMSFHPIPFKEACLSPNLDETIFSETNKFYIYGVIARLAILTASKEIYNTE
ncbi:MAG: glutamate--cysteine ligase [Gammaproteobacteria bacterium]|nr:glutamate--cysteine ligase [Gammaproteobacteria bacterium]|tara:strand:- start:1346 stop:2590 length:1245 start_codon:yes stop_codon:yes gene_type:complete